MAAIIYLSQSMDKLSTYRRHLTPDYELHPLGYSDHMGVSVCSTPNVSMDW